MSTVQPSPSPYARNPVPVAHAFVAGRDAADVGTASDDCPFDADHAPDEHAAWHRGFRHALGLLRGD